VLLDTTDGVETWGAIGVSENVIEASWEALVDSLEAGMLPGRADHARPREVRTAPASGPRA
jgi:2-isopropylmalate synthase